MSSHSVTKVTRYFQRADGSEVRITAEFMTGHGLTSSIDVHVHYRKSPHHHFKLCSNRPHPDWLKMSVAEYTRKGRSEMLSAASISEILGVIMLIGRPMHSQLA